MGEQLKFMEKLYDYNAARPEEKDRRRRILKELFAEIGDGCHIEAPLHANWGCRRVHFGSGIYCHFNVTLVDDADIYVGDGCMIAPNVVIGTSGQLVPPLLREYSNFPVHIGKNVWIGPGARILPGVTIGDNSVIGAGSVVINDIPSNAAASGIPCRVIRRIEEKDRNCLFKYTPSQAGS
jgi:galactoside O-acetyltransferase